MKITVRYFASLREDARTDAEVVDWPGAECAVGSLREFLAARTPALATLLRAPHLLVAVNREYASAETALREGDEVALLPPLSGG